MRSGTIIALLTVVLIFPAVFASLAQPVPYLINYQGRLTDPAGVPLDGTSVDITFAFYGTQAGGTAYFEVIQQNVQVHKGIYNVLIGSGILIQGTEPDLASVFKNHSQVWMGIQVESDPEMTPLTLIGSVPYSIMSEKAVQADSAEVSTLSNTAKSVDIAFLQDLDLDGDGHYKPVSSNLPNDDCDDGNPSVYLHAFEDCGDGLDTSCVNGDCRGTGFYDTPGSARSVFSNGNFVYVADLSNGLLVIDVMNPYGPTLTGSYNPPSSDYGVTGSGSYAYTASGFSGLYVINVSDPSAPFLTGQYNTPGEARDVVVIGSYAYLTDYTYGLQVINISVPSAPGLAGTYDTAGYAVGLDVVGGYAYVADDSAGLKIIDVSTPSAPTLVGVYDTPGSALGVAVAGGYAYVANASSGFFVIDVSTPSAPFEVGYCNTPGTAWDVHLNGNYAYVADGASGLQVIDIADPSAPYLAGEFDTPDFSYSVDGNGDYIYLADDDSGLHVVFAPNPL